MGWLAGIPRWLGGINSGALHDNKHYFSIKLIRMKSNQILPILLCLPLLHACATPGQHPNDPYESINRKIYAFNVELDERFLKPTAKIYAKVIPEKARAGINNAYNNVNLLPTVANDILQAKGNAVIKDTWRFLINSTLGVAGIFDPASTFGLPPHSNDLGLTFAQWGDKHSPYIMLPFLGPSTIRDGMGMLFDYTFFTPYPYLPYDSLIYGLMALRYVDLRSQMFDTEKLMQDAIDKYAFMRDAYLQHRDFLIRGEQPDDGALYVDDTEAQPNTDKLLEQKPANGTPSKFPLTTA